MTDPAAPPDVDCEQEHAELFVSDIPVHALVGVGSHDKATLRHIEKLKEKHGIDYDSHGSYRFVER